MATATWGVLEPFDVSQPASWDIYSQRVHFYILANGVTTSERKRAVFLSVCGAQTFAIVCSLVSPLSPQDKTLEEILALLKGHFSPKPSEIYQRFQFHRRGQLLNEGISSYVAELRKLAQHCNFGDVLDTTLRDRLVCGVRDEALQRRLLAEATLTFPQAMERALAAEAAMRHVAEIRNASSLPVSSVSAVSVEGKASTSSKRWQQSTEKSAVKGACYSCGGSHLRSQCKFREVECHKCKKTGHIARVCRSKSTQKGVPKTSKLNHVGIVDLEVLPSVYELNLVESEGPSQQMTTTLLINDTPCMMEVDSGARVSIIDEDTYNRCFPEPREQLKKSPFILRDYGKRAVDILGVITARVRYGHREVDLPVHVSRSGHRCLLGVNWFQALGISVAGVLRVDEKVEYQRVEDMTKIFNEFSEVFAEGLGKFRGPPVTLHLDPDFPPKFLRARNVPFALRPKIEKEIERLLEEKVLEPVTQTEWGTPVVPVIKLNGDIRLCGDYKSTLNLALKRHPYPVPVISQQLASLAGGRFFGKIDLANAFLQLQVDEASARAQTITTHRGAFKCNRLQFGVSSAPGIFQQFMETLLAGIDGVLPYYDDVLFMGFTVKELGSRFRQILRRLSDAGIRVRREKCVVGVSSVEFLGYQIDEYGIHPTAGKVRAIQCAPEPKNREELQAFLGFLNFYHMFLENKATIAEPLHRLLDKSAVWKWTEVHSQAFAQVKGLLSSSSLLVHFDPSLPIILTSDASPYGIGVVLSHKLKNGKEAPVAFHSQTMNETERRYSQIDKEALAIICGVKKFHNFIYGQEVEIRTDHKPLLGLFASDRPTPDILSPRMLRWSQILKSYDYQLVYVPGKQIGNADGLSRLPLQVSGSTPPDFKEVLLLEALEAPPLTAEQIAKMTMKDPILVRVLDWVMRGWPAHSEERFQPYHRRQLELSSQRGCLLWGCRVVIPEMARQYILKTLHDSHQGISRTKSLARSYLWWPGLDKQIEEMIAACDVCQQSRHAPPKAPVIPWEFPSRPWSRLHLDHAGPYQGSLFLIIIDAFSKWLEVVRVPSTNTQSTVEVLRSLWATHGVPETIVTDNGTGFTSEEFQRVLKMNGITHVTIAPRHPSSNGQAESMVKVTKDALSRIIQGDWKLRLAKFLMAQHVTPHSTTGRSPAELLFNRRIGTVLDRLHPDFAKEMREKINVTRQLARDSSRLRVFDIADPVYVKGFGGHEKWVPAHIISVLGSVSYKVQTTAGQEWSCHVDQLRRRSPGNPDTVVPGLDTLLPTIEIQRDDHRIPDQVEEPVIGSGCDGSTSKIVEPVPVPRPLRVRRPPQRLGVST